MAMAGGSFVTQNKDLPGAYINFVSASKAYGQVGERGVSAVPLTLPWGPEGEVFEVSADTFVKKSQSLFGYSSTHESLRPFSEMFAHAKTVYCYRLNTGVKASNTFAEAKYSGIRGNDLAVSVVSSASKSGTFQVVTLLDRKTVDTQTVTDSANLVDNDFVKWKTFELGAVLASPLEGGTNGEAVTGTEVQDFLNAIQAFSFDTLACPFVDTATIALFTAFTRRMREEHGFKFQAVVYRSQADYEGIISVENAVTDGPEYSLVYWVAGAVAGCNINRSLTNTRYDGSYKFDTKLTLEDLTNGVKSGKFIFYNATGGARVLTDINTLVTFADGKSQDFSSNQVIRVIDQVAKDIAAIFSSQYLGVVPNDNSGRASLWADIVAHHRQLASMRAIENFTPEQITVLEGSTKKSVSVTDNITVTGAMEQLYMTVIVE